MLPQDDDVSGRVASVGSVVSGCLFAAGWYIFLGALLLARTDCIVWGSFSEKHILNCTDHNRTWHNDDRAPEALISGAYWAPGILSSFGLVGLNMISWEAIVEEGSFGDGVVVCARVWAMSSLILLFGGLGVAIWMFVDVFSVANYWPWGGICCLVQNLLIMFSAVLFRMCRRSGDHSI